MLCLYNTITKYLLCLLQEWCQPTTHQTPRATEEGHRMDARFAKGLSLWVLWSGICTWPLQHLTYDTSVSWLSSTINHVNYLSWVGNGIPQYHYQYKTRAHKTGKRLTWEYSPHLQTNTPTRLPLSCHPLHRSEVEQNQHRVLATPGNCKNSVLAGIHRTRSQQTKCELLMELCSLEGWDSHALQEKLNMCRLKTPQLEDKLKETKVNNFFKSQ